MCEGCLVVVRSFWGSWLGREGMGEFENGFCMFRKCFVHCLIVLDSFVDVELERKRARYFV